MLTRQLLEDTAVEAAAKPLKTVLQGTCDIAEILRNSSEEIFCKRLLLPHFGTPPPIADERLLLDPIWLEMDLACRHLKPLQPAQVRLIVEGEESLRTLEGLIECANQSIDVLMYQWDSDVLGWALAERLAARAASLGQAADGGPSVRVLVDGGGTLIHGPPEAKTAGQANEAIVWLAQQPNVCVLRTRNGLAHFDHRKLVVVDGRLAWSGGRNFTLSSFFDYHDLSYLLHGPLVEDMALCFEDSWREAGGTPRSHRESTGGLPKGINAQARVVGTGRKRRDFVHLVYRAIDHAWHHVYLENPYFTDTRLIWKLAQARKRGVDVRVVFARHSQSDVIDQALHVTTNRLLKAGIRVYTYPGTTHVKAASVDGRWAYIGTGNFDTLSLRRNNEIGLAIGEGPLIDELEQCLFLPDFRPEWEVTSPYPVTFNDCLLEILAGLIL